MKHDVVDSYGVTPLVYAKQLNQHDCATLIANFNPERPHDVLIPIESLAEHSNSIKKITSHRASMSNLEQDVFLLIPSCQKKQSNIEEVVLWQKQSLSNGHSPQPNKDTSGNTVDIEIKYSDCDSSWSADEEKSGSRANHLGSSNLFIFIHDSPLTLSFSSETIGHLQLSLFSAVQCDMCLDIFK